jgi:signal transduction histidine kinase
LDELRDLARGIHPPILDSGLEAALTTLAARSATPVRLRIHLPVRPPPAIETILYFCAAELLTNVAKHSAAQQVSRRIPILEPHTLTDTNMPLEQGR